MSAVGESREQALGLAGSYGCSSSAAAQARMSAGTRICALKICAQRPTVDVRDSTPRVRIETLSTGEALAATAYAVSLIAALQLLQRDSLMGWSNCTDDPRINPLTTSVDRDCIQQRQQGKGVT